MRNRLIYICSPLRGDIEKNIQKAQGYCREAVELWPDVIPIAPHVYCTQFLDDTIPQEREAGMELGIALLDMCDELWVYGINNPSEGMKKEIAYAKEHGIPVKTPPISTASGSRRKTGRRTKSWATPFLSFLPTPE